MPRIYPLLNQYTQSDLLREIRSRQGYHGYRTDKALAIASGIPYQTMLRRLANPDDLTLGELRKLNKTIQLDLEILLTAAGCSRKDIKKYKETSA